MNVQNFLRFYKRFWMSSYVINKRIDAQIATRGGVHTDDLCAV